MAELTLVLEKPLRVLYVGDYDPSGMGMSEVDLPRRMAMYGAENFRIIRVSLTVDDVVRLPSFPAADKAKDPRYAWFITHYGRECWELDAMNPNTLRTKVERAILRFLDMAAWNACQRTEAAQVETFQTVLTAMKRQVGAKSV